MKYQASSSNRSQVVVVKAYFLKSINVRSQFTSITASLQAAFCLAIVELHGSHLFV